MVRRTPQLTLPVLASMLALLASGPGAAQDMQQVSFRDSGWASPHLGPRPAPDGLLVDLADDLDDADVAELAAQTGLHFERTSTHVDGNRYEVHGVDLQRAKALLEDVDGVESVEQNVFYSLVESPNAPVFGQDDDDDDEDAPEAKRPSKPNDPMYGSQWNFKMVNAEGAWPRSTGEGVVVAVIDTGVSPGKLDGKKKSRYRRVPDLKETKMVPGWNFVRRNADPSDGNGHGTHVAGTIAQSTNNAFGVAGLAYDAKIMPIKVLSDRGFGSVGDIANGIRFAADNGAQVINMSLGGGGYSASLARAVKYAHDKGLVVACAAGNGGREKVEFPAAYPEAFAVSALGPDGELALYSSYGKETDIAAPGGDTRVDLNGDGIPDGVLQDTIARGDPSKHGFFPFQGTSMATPHVAAAAALVIATGVTDPDRVEEILRKSAKDLHDPIRYGAGRLDVASAVTKSEHDHSYLSLALAALLGLMVVRRNRRKDTLATFRVGPGFVGALVAGSAGLFFLNDLGLHAGVLAAPLGDWPGLLLGQGWHLNALVGSAAIPLVLATLFFGIKRMRGILAGFALGFAGFLLARAGLGSVNVQWVPGHGVLDAMWLGINGLFLVFLARVTIMRD